MMTSIRRCFAIVGAITLAIVANTASHAASPVELRTVTAWPPSAEYNLGFTIWKKEVEKALGDSVKIKYLGGPEVIPSFRQVEAIKNGAVDVVFTTPAYYATSVPEIIVMGFTELSADELRKNGALAYMDKLLGQKVNARILGAYWYYGSAIFLTKKINTMADLKGKKIRTGSFIPFLKALGAAPIRMPLSEVFTSLQRGVIDGLTSPELIADKSIRSQLKYKVLPTFYNVSFNILINKDAWAKLPDATKQKLAQISIAVDPIIQKTIAARIKKGNEDAKAAGMQDIVLPNGKEYVALAYDSAWKFIHTRMPKEAPKLTSLFRKTK